jgi:post-segregation antitoxin (ccd killing protein)
MHKRGDARKRAVNLTLDHDLVRAAKTITGNLSAVVESLLVEFVAHEQEQRLAKKKAVEATTKIWNEFNAKTGSFADAYSSL